MERIVPINLEDELQSSYIDYAMSVIVGRAIPDARDGLKPVQRRILYAMYSINNVHTQPTKKSARVTGEVIGKYHPHGDIAVYDALVRMAQEFSMNHKFVEGQGNFGSVDGDPPAAMRYTEVRLTKLAGEMLADLEKNTVDMQPNFDNTEKEPVLLPAKLPNLLINGTSGIAVGVSTSIPPHNLKEVCDAILHLLANPEAHIADIMNIIKGPDFPTGGIALLSSRTSDAYVHGRGRVTIRANAIIDEKNRQIVFDEMPYATNKASIIQNIASLVKDKIITGISNVRDESDKDGIRVVIELKSDANPQIVLNSLFKHTQLESTFPMISLAVVGNKLRSLNLLEMLKVFIDHRRTVIRRRSEYELGVARDRDHIVEGLIVAIGDIDNIVKLVRNSRELADARRSLIEQYNFSEKQANAILDMKISKLTSLEHDSLEREKKELEEKIRYFTSVIENPKLIDEIITKETTDISVEYGRPRRTKLIVSEGEEISDESLIKDEEVTVIFTNSGYVKRMGIDSYKEQGRGGRGVIAMGLKENDYVKQIVRCMTKDYLVCITDKGRAFWLKAYAVPEEGRYAEGKAIVNMLNLNEEKVVTILSAREFEDKSIVFLTTRGLVKKSDAILFSRPRSTGVRAITINDGDSISDAKLYSGNVQLMIVTKKGKCIRFDEEDVRQTGRTSMGVRGIRLQEGDSALGVIPMYGDGYVLTVTEKGYGKLTETNMYRVQSRGGSGVINIKTSDKTGEVAKAMFVNQKSAVLLMSSNGVIIKFSVDSVRITGRAAKGVRLMKVEQGSRIVDARLIEQDDEDAESAQEAEIVPEDVDE